MCFKWSEERTRKETDLKSWCLHRFTEPDGKCNKFVYDTAPGEAMHWVQVGAGGFAVMQRECGFGRRGQPAFFFLRWREKYTCQRNEPGLWINELAEGRKYLFSFFSFHATPGFQSHCKISNNLTRLFAFKSLFLTLCKSLSRAEVAFSSQDLVARSQSYPVPLPLLHWVVLAPRETIYETPAPTGFVWSWVKDESVQISHIFLTKSHYKWIRGWVWKKTHAQLQC